MTWNPESDWSTRECESCGAPNASWWEQVSKWLCDFCGRT